MSETQELESRIQQLEDSIHTLTTEVRSLLNLWEQAKGVLGFVRALAWIGSTLGGVFIFYKVYIAK